MGLGLGMRLDSWPHKKAEEEGMESEATG